MNIAQCIQTLSSSAYPCQTAMALVDETSCPSLFVGNDGYIMRTNQLFSAVSGYEINDINGKRWTEFLDTKGQGDITESIVSSFRFYREHTINIYDCALIDYRNKMKELAIEIKRAKGGFLALFHVIPYFKSKVETMPRCETQKTYNSFVEALMKTMMSRDPLIAAHEQAVSDLAGMIADQMELSSFTCEGIRIASLIHDSGNLSVPMDILTKSEMLSEEEWEVIRSHPRMGYEIIRHVKFPWPVAATVLQHHERLNGSGYPYGLKNDEIMIEARILAVADTYIAMRSQRPYRTPVDHEWAMAELYAGRGFLFDERAVDACARCVRL